MHIKFWPRQNKSGLIRIDPVPIGRGNFKLSSAHTMLGNVNDPDITRRAIMDLFQAILVSSGHGFLLRTSYIEIYNEEIKDLLASGSDNLKIHEDVANKRVYINTHEEVITSARDVMQMLARGERTCAVGVTNMNERSSRLIQSLHCELRVVKSIPNPKMVKMRTAKESAFESQH